MELTKRKDRGSRFVERSEGRSFRVPLHPADPSSQNFDFRPVEKRRIKRGRDVREVMKPKGFLDRLTAAL